MKSKKYAIIFAAGIPIWSIAAYGLDCLNRAPLLGGNWGDGAGTQANNSLFHTKTSYLIFGYFIFSSLVCLFSKNKHWRIFYGVMAHLILLASMGSVLLPDYFSQSVSPGTPFMETIILGPAYLIFFAPWVVTWMKCIHAR